jgi:hypothetical protein
VFELESLTKVRVLDVRVLSKKDRKPDETPGAQLLLQATLSCGVLAMFDGFLPGMLFRKADGKKQGELEGVESAELSAIGEHVKRMGWVYEQTGCSILIDYGMGERSNINLDDCKAHRVSFAPKAGGSVLVQWTVDAPALSDETRGKLTGLKSTDVQMTMHAPRPEEDAQQQIEERPKPAKRTKVIDGTASVESGSHLTPEKALADSVGSPS